MVAPTVALIGVANLVVAVVIPRGGLGSLGAGPAAIEIIQAAYKLGFYGPMQELESAAPAPPPSPAPTTRPSASPR